MFISSSASLSFLLLFIFITKILRVVLASSRLVIFVFVVAVTVVHSNSVTTVFRKIAHRGIVRAIYSLTLHTIIIKI